MNEVLLYHKDFIYAVAKDLIRPDNSNDKVKAVLSAIKDIPELNTAEILIECATCTNIYKNSFSLILAYINAGTTITNDDIMESMKGAYNTLDSFIKPKKKK